MRAARVAHGIHSCTHRTSDSAEQDAPVWPGKGVSGGSVRPSRGDCNVATAEASHLGSPEPPLHLFKANGDARADDCALDMTSENDAKGASSPGHLQRQSLLRKCCSFMCSISNGTCLVLTLAIALGLFVACFPSLRRVFSVSNRAPGQLAVVTHAISRLGGAAVPCMMIAMGGTISRGPGGAAVPWRAVLALVVIRLVVLPAAGGWVVLAAQSRGVWADNGSMFTLVLLLQQAMPTTMHVYTVASVHGNNEQVVVALLFWQYIASIVTIPVSLLIFQSRIAV